MTSHEEYLLRTGRMKDQDGNLVREGNLVAYRGDIMRVKRISGQYADLVTPDCKHRFNPVSGRDLLLVAK